MRAFYVAGCALRETFPALIAESPLAGLLEPLFVENRFFGGNVDVTGLLCGEDVAAAIRARAGASASRALFLLPRVMFNDDGETLDGWTLEDVRKAAKCPVSVVSCTPTEYLGEMAELADAAFSL